MKTDLEALKALLDSLHRKEKEVVIFAIAELQAARAVVKSLRSMEQKTGGMCDFRGGYEEWHRLNDALRAYDEVVK